MFKTTKSLVLRETRYKEADRILTLLTEDDGKITAKARGALRKNSKTAAATQQLTYSEMTLFGNNGRWTVNEAAIIEPFTGLREDIASFALGSYFTDCLETLSVEDQPDEQLLQLGLNSLYALSNKLYQPQLIKAAFELRLSCIAGYKPELDACAVCGSTAVERPLLCSENGVVCCSRCRSAEMRNTSSLCSDSLQAMKYVVSAPAKQLFSFSLPEDALKRMSYACEEYFLLHAGRHFGTLDYWKQFR